MTASISRCRRPSDVMMPTWRTRPAAFIYAHHRQRRHPVLLYFLDNFLARRGVEHGSGYRACQLP